MLNSVAITLATVLGLLAQNPSDKPAAPAPAPPTPALVRPSANIAAGKPYTLQPAPSYALCTDPGDATQLTDGVYTQGYFWAQKSTVGWQAGKPVVVTIDLGEVKSIRGLSLNTAAGVAGVTWPSSIDIFVADQPGKYYLVEDLLALDSVHGVPKPNEYATHRYWTDALHTHGRYVILVIAAQPYFFSDEIEVYEGAPEWSHEPRATAPVDNLEIQIQSRQLQSAVRRRIREDAIAVQNIVSGSDAPEPFKQSAKTQLDAAVAESLTAPPPVADGFRSVLPLNALHQKVMTVHAGWWHAKGLKPLTVWTSGLWDMLPLFADPTLAKPAELDVALMQNEYRAGSLNLSNATNHTMAVTLRFADIPGAPIPEYIRVHETAWTDTAQGAPIVAALPDAERVSDGWLIHVPSGMTRQVWFTFHPVATPPGIYQGSVTITGEGIADRAPVKLRIYPLRFPDRPTLHFGGWDYTDVEKMYSVTPQNRDALIALLKEHFVDSPWGTSGVLPFGAYDATGAMTTSPDAAQFDAWLQKWPNSAQYLVFAAVGKKLAQFDAGTEPFNKAVNAWISFWAGHAKAKGLRPEQLAILLVDEPGNAAQQAEITPWAHAIRAANTGIRIWEDPVFDLASEADLTMLKACDAICPNRPKFLSSTSDYRELFAAQRAPGATLEFYSCSGPVHLLDPYAYFRLQAWDCRRFGATASYFWAFGDGGGAPSWNAYASAQSDYTPLFLDDTSCVTGKHLEACREGIEDYEYFVMLEKAIARRRAADPNAAALPKAETLLRELPARVCSAEKPDSFRWTNAIDRTGADGARLEVLDVLVELNR